MTAEQHWTDGLATSHTIAIVETGAAKTPLVSLYWDAGRTVALIYDRHNGINRWAREDKS